MFQFDPTAYGSALAELVTRDELPPLGPGPEDATVGARLRDMEIASVIEKPVTNPQMARCCYSALWLFHDFLDQSHDISQAIKSQTGSFLHGIMHRREPDYSNAKYWFRQVGDHPIYPLLAEQSRALAEAASVGKSCDFLVEQADWDPYRFIDLCEASYLAEDAYEELCRRISLLEWQLLFDYCYRRAIA